MNQLPLVSTYILLNLLVIIGYGLLKAWSFAINLSRVRYAAASELRSHYLTLAIIIVSTAAYSFIPKTHAFEPAVKIWAAESNRSFAEQYQAAEQTAFVGLFRAHR